MTDSPDQQQTTGITVGSITFEQTGYRPAEEIGKQLLADWGDKPLPEDDAIQAAHPTHSGRHDLYAEAMRLVGAKRSKGALVELVTWLLLKTEQGNV